MISCVVVFDGWVAGVVYDDTHQYCSRCSHPVCNLVRPRLRCGKIHFETKNHAQKWEDWSFVHFSVRWNGWYNCQQIVACGSSECLWSIKNWFQLADQNLSWLQYCVLLPCVLLRNIVREWFVTTATLPTHVLQPRDFERIFCNDSEAIFGVFRSFPRRSNISIRKRLEKIRKSYSFSENDLKYEITLSKNVFRKASKLPISLEQFLSFTAT